MKFDICNWGNKIAQPRLFHCMDCFDDDGDIFMVSHDHRCYELRAEFKKQDEALTKIKECITLNMQAARNASNILLDPQTNLVPGDGAYYDGKAVGFARALEIIKHKSIDSKD